MRDKIFGPLTPQRRSWQLYPALLLLFLMALGILAGCSPGSQVPIIQAPIIRDNANTATAPTEKAPVLYDENVVVSLYERAIPAVVKIETKGKKKSYEYEFGPFYFRFGPPSPPKAQGSGFIIDKQGHILTNYHVVKDASRVKVTLHNGNILEAKVIGTDPDDDLALLKVDSTKVSNIEPLPLGDSDAVKPGQMAIALGAPFGLEGSITVGVISGVNRTLSGIAERPLTNMLQTDAVITHGNSGGPLLNSKGEVIGINTAIEVESPFSGASGIGFAIPINTAKSALPSLLKGEKVKKPWLGIKGVAVTPELAERLELPVNYGVYVVEVMPDSPAEKAGLRGSGTDRYGRPTFGGDIITAVDGRKVTKVEDLVSYFNTKKPGDEVSLTVYRGNQTMTVKVILGEWPEETPSEKKSPFHWFWHFP